MEMFQRELQVTVADPKKPQLLNVRKVFNTGTNKIPGKRMTLYVAIVFECPLDRCTVFIVLYHGQNWSLQLQNKAGTGWSRRLVAIFRASFGMNCISC
jgi:hypothetical protein